MSDALRADHRIDISYRRSVGGATEVFLAGLRRRQIWGSRRGDGTVEVPPVEWDPCTGEASTGYVELADRGRVESWTWVDRPRPGHPVAGPFAFALIRIDGAATTLLHCVDATREATMVPGLAVRADWREETTGSINDIRAFVPEEEHSAAPPAPPGPPGPPAIESPPEVRSSIPFRYTYRPGVTLSRFLRGLAAGRIEGGRCPGCAAVYVPPRPACPACRSGPLEAVPVPGTGTVVSFTVVHLPFHGMTVELPFVCAWIRLDGADVPFAHLLGELAGRPPAVGDRVEAVWTPPAERTPGWDCIRYFRPAGAPGTGDPMIDPAR